jgi:MHS family proline/betaine transporter-like MFS transporter
MQQDLGGSPTPHVSSPLRSHISSMEREPLSSTTDDATAVDPALLKRAVRGSVVGTIMEWYDVGVFGYLIVTMGPVFLPESDRAVQTLFLLGTFAATFIARPLGGIFYGWLGDRIGRQKVLAATLTLISASTFLIGVLPGYAMIGIWAAILLVVLKVLQGFSAGGEYAGVTTFVGEYSPDSRRGFYSSFMPLGSYAGFALGAATVAIIQTVLGEQAMVEYGWRIPFLVAGPLALIALWFRYRVEESPAFKAVLLAQEEKSKATHQRHQASFGNTIRKYWKLIAAAIVVVAAENIAAYALTSYMPTYLTLSLGYNAIESTWLTVPILVATALAMPLFGHISDKIGQLTMMRIAACLSIVVAVPAFVLLGSSSAWTTILGLTLIALPAILFGAAIPAAIPGQFPTVMRFLCMGITYNVAVAAFGGTSPLVMDSLINMTGNTLVPAYYIMASGAAALIALIILNETAKRPLIGSAPNVTKEEANRRRTEQGDQPKSS